MGLPWWLSSKEFACNVGDVRDTGLIPGLGKSPGEGHGNLQFSRLENPVDRGAWHDLNDNNPPRLFDHLPLNCYFNFFVCLFPSSFDSA